LETYVWNSLNDLIPMGPSTSLLITVEWYCLS
jgi:hypothetical protein